jgi:uncharacterized SAM-binding protein YcdF (DUF218 family)
MPVDNIPFHSFRIHLILAHFFIPVLVEFCDFFNMGHTNLPLLLLEPAQQFFLSLFFELLFDLH